MSNTEIVDKNKTLPNGRPSTTDSESHQDSAPLFHAAREAANSNEFIRLIQDRNLLRSVYDWEQSTPANQARFKHSGWFGIASAFWNEQACCNRQS